MKAQTTPAWLDRDEYPFPPKFAETPYGKMHYVDEGAGEVILFLHGNPTWSFEHRALIKKLSKTYRCIAPDYIGFGLSDKPYDVSYLPQFHAENIERFIDGLGIKDITLVLHDWGGPIGMSYALKHPEKTRRIITYNSWFWSARGVKNIEGFSAVIGGPVGRFFCRNFNLFPKVLMRADFGDPTKLSKHIHEMFIAPFPTGRSRKGTWVFPKALIGQSAWLESLWAKRESLKHVPLLILWGLKDRGFPESFVSRWESVFPKHTTIKFDNVGHFSPEEIGSDALAPVESFLRSNP